MKVLYELLAIAMLFLGGEGVVHLCDLYERLHPGVNVWSSLFLTLYMVLFGTFVCLSYERGARK